MEDNTTIIDQMNEKAGIKPDTGKKAGGNGWSLVDRFAINLEKQEKSLFIMFIMAMVALGVGFALGFMSCMLGYISVQ